MKDSVDSNISSSSSNASNSDIITLSDTESDSDKSSTSVEIVEIKCNDIIELDDTIENTENVDKSVITINDSTVLNVTEDHFKLDTTPDFIPINFSYNDRSKRKRTLRRKRLMNRSQVNCNNSSTNVPNSKKKSRIVNGNYNISVTPIIQLNYPNILKDNAIETQKIGLRPIIIDGCNVGFGYGNGNFMMRGIILVIQYFKNRGHDEIVCFLPQRFRHRVRSPSEDRVVDTLEKENVFSFTPSRNLENGKRYTPYDDRYIVQYAAERQGIIISNDGYRDLINEEPSWRETIEKRIINYTFARGMFMLPKDPLGPTGPTLDEMLKFPS